MKDKIIKGTFKMNTLRKTQKNNRKLIIMNNILIMKKILKTLKGKIKIKGKVPEESLKISQMKLE